MCVCVHLCHQSKLVGGPKGSAWEPIGCYVSLLYVLLRWFTIYSQIRIVVLLEYLHKFVIKWNSCHFREFNLYFLCGFFVLFSDSLTFSYSLFGKHVSNWSISLLTTCMQFASFCFGPLLLTDWTCRYSICWKGVREKRCRNEERQKRWRDTEMFRGISDIWHIVREILCIWSLWLSVGFWRGSLSSRSHSWF